MNERIKELREQSIKWAYENQQSMDGAMDKFAELIVRECAEVSKNYAGGSMPVSIASAIKQHFGVK